MYLRSSFLSQYPTDDGYRTSYVDSKIAFVASCKRLSLGRMTMTKGQKRHPPTAVLVFRHGRHKVADSRLGRLGTLGIDCLVLVLWSLLLQ
jgi:hypothetical protein